MEELAAAMGDQGQFQHFAQSLKPPNGPPPNVIAQITEDARRVFGGSARLTRQGSTKKHTDIIGSDFDYHLETPDRHQGVSRDDMIALQRLLMGHGVDAEMGPTALKIRCYCNGEECSVDVVPRDGRYFDPGVVVEPHSPAFRNDIRRQNAARVIKYYVKKCLQEKVKSFSLEEAVLSEDARMTSGNREADPHGLELFKRTCRALQYDIPVVVYEEQTRNVAHRAKTDWQPVWQGSHKCVAKGRYCNSDGKENGDECVVKWFKDKVSLSHEDFQADLDVIAETKRIVHAFNEQVSPPRKVFVNDAQVWSEIGGRRKVLVEPMIQGTYTHFNSNTGYQADGFHLMAALSHFSYHFTVGAKVLCDLQGGRYSNAYVLTDPVLLSSQQRFGATDLGRDGIDNFFSQHRCTCYCSRDWRMPANPRQIFQVVQGSTLLVDNQIHYGAVSQPLDQIVEGDSD